MKIKALALNNYIELIHSEITTDEIETLLKFYADVYQEALMEDIDNGTFLVEEYVDDYEETLSFMAIHNGQMVAAISEDKNTIYNVAPTGSTEEEIEILKAMIDALTTSDDLEFESIQDDIDILTESLELKEQLIEELDEQIAELIQNKEQLELHCDQIIDELDQLEEEKDQLLENKNVVPSLYEMVFKEKCDCECENCKCKH